MQRKTRELAAEPSLRKLQSSDRMRHGQRWKAFEATSSMQTRGFHRDGRPNGQLPSLVDCNLHHPGGTVRMASLIKLAFHLSCVQLHAGRAQYHLELASSNAKPSALASTLRCWKLRQGPLQRLWPCFMPRLIWWLRKRRPFSLGFFWNSV